MRRHPVIQEFLVSSKSLATKADPEQEERSTTEENKTALNKQRRQAKQAEKVLDVEQARKREWIGPAHGVSNIRPYRIPQPPDETRLHRRYRLLKQETIQFNHKFWSQHNTQFNEASDLTPTTSSHDMLIFS